MFCSKIGTECPHSVIKEDKSVFVIMPFAGFATVYDYIRQTVEILDGFKCERADDTFTTTSIWCKNICQKIRKAKYLIADTTGRNPNVFYELGFGHALNNTKAIIITQQIEQAPFDIRDVNHIVYSSDDLPKLRMALRKAIEDMENQFKDDSYSSNSSEEIISDLKSQLRDEECRAEKFKTELRESEDRERKLKERIREIEAIRNNPAEEAINKIAEYEGIIAELKSRLKHTEEDKKDTIEQLNRTINDTQIKLDELEREFESYKSNNNSNSLEGLLLDDTKRKAEAQKWFNKAYDESQLGNKEKAIQFYSKAIELDPKYSHAFNNRATVFGYLGEHDKAMEDYDKAIELEPDDYLFYTNRGSAYCDTRNYNQALEDYLKAVELNLDDPDPILCLAELQIIFGNYQHALVNTSKALPLCSQLPEQLVCYFLETVANILLSLDISESEKNLNVILKSDCRVSWSFEALESWLEDAALDENKKSYIISLLQEVKKCSI